MKIILNVLCALLFTVGAQSQTLKLGHVNITNVLESLPDYKTTETKLKDFATKLQQTVVNMEGEYQKLVQEFYDLPETTPPLVKEDKARQITDLENRIIKMRASSEDQLMQKQVELLKPLEDKVMGAIKSVATEKGFHYVFDSSVGSTLLYYPPADDMTEMIKTKLLAK